MTYDMYDLNEPMDVIEALAEAGFSPVDIDHTLPSWFGRFDGYISKGDDNALFATIGDDEIIVVWMNLNGVNLTPPFHIPLTEHGLRVLTGIAGA